MQDKQFKSMQNFKFLKNVQKFLEQEEIVKITFLKELIIILSFFS